MAILFSYNFLFFFRFFRINYSTPLIELSPAKDQVSEKYFISAHSNWPHYKLHKERMKGRHHTRFWSNCEIKMPQIVVFGLYREIKMPPNPNLSKESAKVLYLEHFLHQNKLSWPYDSYENLRSVHWIFIYSLSHLQFSILLQFHVS